MVDKNKATIEFLMQCPTIQENPLFFNFADEEDGNNHVITNTDRTKTHFIDGSVRKQYTFTIACYKSVAHVALITGTDNQNMEDMATVQAILDWIDGQAEDGVYPDFGESCEIEEMRTMTTDPDLDGIDTSVNPPIARYSISVRIRYIDNSKKLWNS